MTAHAVEASSAWADLAATLVAKETATASVTRRRRDAGTSSGLFFSRRMVSSPSRLFFSARRTCRLRRCVDTPVGRLVFLPRRPPFGVRSGRARVSLMIRRIPCQDSDELLLVELRVETFSSAAFLLRDARDVHIGGAFFPTAFFSTDASRDSVSICSHPRSFDEYTRWRNTVYSWRSSTISSLTRGTH